MPPEEQSDIADAPRGIAPALCIACGYDLRGLADGGSCPECGHPILESRQSATLRGAGTAWLSTLARWATVMAVIDAIGACVTAILLYDRLCLTALEGLPIIPTRFWYPPVHVLIGIAELIAIWRLTIPLPAPSDDDSQRSIRMWLRFVCTSATCGTVLLRTDAISLMAVARFWAVVTNVLFAVEVWLFWSYISRLSERIPNGNLVRQSHSVRWGLTIGVLAGPTLGWVVHGNKALSYGFRLFGPLPGTLLGLAYGVIAPFVLLSFAARLRSLRNDFSPKAS